MMLSRNAQTNYKEISSVEHYLNIRTIYASSAINMKLALQTIPADGRCSIRSSEPNKRRSLHSADVDKSSPSDLLSLQ
uniref:Uncharacterized protein n=1 Tax=Ditylenchus dipsaci TaxID=166011 RepID=A0A915DCN1_9BILA